MRWILYSNVIVFLYIPSLLLSANIEASNIIELRDSIIMANTNYEEDVISLKPEMTYEISHQYENNNAFPDFTCEDGEIITIEGNGSTLSRSEASTETFRFFMVRDSAYVVIKNLTLKEGFLNSASGGAIYNQGHVILESCRLEGNVSGSGGAICNILGICEMTNCSVIGNKSEFGGGILNYMWVWHDTNSSMLTMNKCTISNNVSENTGAGGGIANHSYLNLENCTISGNTAGYDGGGLYTWAISGWDEVVIKNCTITKNKAHYGNGIYFNSTSLNYDMGNTIVAGNGIYSYSLDMDRNSKYDDVWSMGNNLIGCLDLSLGYWGFIDGEKGDMVGTEDKPKKVYLGPLQDNGGPTMTHAPLLEPWSPAINNGHKKNFPETDQRGFPRPEGGRSDIGSVELWFPDKPHGVFLY